jgi:hypothetical protein
VRRVPLEIAIARVEERLAGVVRLAATELVE